MCSFLPLVPVDIISGHRGTGGIAVNVDGTLSASVDKKQHCVYIYNASDRTVIVGTAGTAGRAHGLLHRPCCACFVRCDGVDTLLICDWGNDRVVEVTPGGVFLRAIAMKKGSRPWGIAERDGVIAVSLFHFHAVVLLQYDTGVVKPEVTIGLGTPGRADGQLHFPTGVAITADGHHILVADCFNQRVGKFSSASGAFVAQISDGIAWPRDVLQCEDGSMVVACNSRVVHVGKDSAVQNIGGALIPRSLSYSPSLNGVVIIKCSDGSVFVLRDAWSHSLRCAWVHACVLV